MNGTVLDILIYVFDRYMFDEPPEVPEREALARDLESAGFGEANVERALDWLADLAGERDPGSTDAEPAQSPRSPACALAAHLRRHAKWRACRPTAAACCCRWNRPAS